MAVFLAASDEALGEGVFHHAGYLAPVACWTDFIIPAWEKEVLAGPPLLDEFHMVDLRSRSWREAHGITREDVETRIDAAVEILTRAKGLYAVRSSVDGIHFDEWANGLRFKLNDPRRAPADFVSDYPSFLGYIYSVLFTCASYPQAEKVDFVIEEKKEVFAAIHDFYESVRESLPRIGLSHVAQIMGELTPGDKKRIPLQAADILCWHTQRWTASTRNAAITFSEVDRERYSKLIRLGSGHTWSREMIEGLCNSLFEDWRKLNEVEGISEVRSNNEDDSPRRSARSESRDGSGETRTRIGSAANGQTRTRTAT